MRVAINLLYVDPRTCGGTGVYATRLVQALASVDKLREYVLLLREENQALFQDLTGFNLTRLILHPGETISAYSARLRALRPDVVHHPITTIHPMLDVPAPIVLSFFDLQHEYYPEYFSDEELELRAKTYRPSVEQANRIVTSSRYTIRTLEEKYGTDPAKCTAVLGGINVDLWRRADVPSVHAIREKYHLPETFLIYPANPWPHKNHERLFQALAALRARHGQSPALILTGHLDRYQCDISAMADRHAAKDLVHDLGLVPQEDMPALYSAATGMVFPSLFEGGGSFAMLEAMACQLPMACAEATSTPEIVGDASILFDPTNVSSIADSIHCLVTDEALRAQLVMRGLERLGRHRHDAVARKMMQIYDDVADAWAVQQRASASRLTVVTTHQSEEAASVNKEDELAFNDRNVDLAETRFKQAYELAPNNIGYSGRVLKDAIQRLDVDHMVDRTTHTYSLCAEGEVLFQSGDIEGARKTFLRAYEQDSSNPELCNNLAVCLWQQGNPGEALLYLSRGLAVSPDYKPLILNGGRILVECNHHDEARALLTSYLSDYPDDADIQELMQSIVDRRGKRTAAADEPATRPPDVHGEKTGDNEALVSAVVSTYNSEQYLSGCLEDLEAQTIAHRIEIIVVDSGSQQNERVIVAQFQKQYSNIRYIRTDERETIYAAWNRGIRAAKGRYITNANTDDRHRRDALERMAAVLESRADVALVYADARVTKRPDSSFDTAVLDGCFHWPEHDARKLFEVCYIGPQPMWRRELHARYGEFDAVFEVAGDYEFWLRIAASETFCHIPEELGLYLATPQGMESRNPHLCSEESDRARARHWPLAWGARPVPAGSFFVPSSDVQEQYTPVMRRNADQPLVSIIMPTKDRRALIANAFKSISAQDYPNWELVLVNDGGEDIADLVNQHLAGQNVHYISTPQSAGQVVARNIALKSAHGDIICYLDDDDRYLPNHLSTVVATIQQENCEFVYTDAEYITQAAVDNNCSEVARGNPYEHGRFSMGQLLVRNYIPINSWAHTRNCLWEVGLFEETLPCLEDWELLIRFATRYSCHHIPITTVEVYARADTQDNVSDRNRRLFLPTFLEIYKRHGDRGDTTIRARREEMLESLAHEAVVAGIINGKLEDVFEAVLAELYGNAGHDTSHTAELTESKRSEEESGDRQYQQWIGKHTLQEVDQKILAERVAANADNLPAIHLIAVVNPGCEGLLADTIDSLKHQLYRGWGLSVVASNPAPDSTFDQHGMLEWVQARPDDYLETINTIVGESAADWVAIIEAGDSLESHALLSCVAYIQQRPQWRYIYCDEDVISAGGVRTQPCFKPDINLDLLRSTPYIGGFCLVARELLSTACGFEVDPGIWNYDLVFRAIECCGESAIGHVPELLSHRHVVNQRKSEQSAVEEKTRSLLVSHLERCNVPATVTDGLSRGSFFVQYEHENTPLVSIIIPTKDRLDLIKPCVSSLLEKTTYPNYEVLVVDNNSSDPDVLCYLESLEVGAARVNVLRYPHKYNFSAINNFAAARANGDYLLLLNNDTLVVQPNWLERMVAHAQRPEVGIVGARLVFPDQTLQHAGVVMGLRGAADHVHLGTPLTDDGYMGRAQLVQNFSAVTAACLLISRNLYKDVEGLDEKNFKVLYNDVDLCLKVADKGYKIVWTPYATVVHYGSSSLKEETDPKRRQENFRDTFAMFEKWLAKMAHDPAYNRNLTLVERNPKPETDIVMTWNPDFHDRARILGFPFDTWGCGEYRVNAPMRALHQSSLAQTACVPPANIKRIPDIGELARLAPDSLLLQSFVHDYQILALEAYRKLLPESFMVFELDDLKTDMPHKNPHSKTMYRDIRKRLRKALGYCDRMIVTTEPLAEAYGKYVDDIIVVPNSIDMTRWKDAVPLRQQGSKPRVGWAGAQQHHGDLALLHEVVRDLADEVEWVFFGMCPKELKPYISEFHEGVTFEHYPARLASLNLDLALAPLEHNKFNEAKSNLRLLEYGIMGWPVIATDIYPYQGAPIAPVANNPRAWINAIREHINDPAASAAAGDRLRQWVLDNWLLEHHLKGWLNALTPAAQAASAGDELRQTGTG